MTLALLVLSTGIALATPRSTPPAHTLTCTEVQMTETGAIITDPVAWIVRRQKTFDWNGYAIEALPLARPELTVTLPGGIKVRGRGTGTQAAQIEIAFPLEDGLVGHTLECSLRR